MSSTRPTRPPDRRLFTSPLLTEPTSSTQPHPCRVCGVEIPALEVCLFRAWHLEYSHLACRWIRDDEVKPHVRRKPGSYSDYWEWRCTSCGLDACSVRQPDDESEMRCARCAPEQFTVTDGCRVELVTSITHRIGNHVEVIPRGTRGYVRALDTTRVTVEWRGRFPRIAVPHVYIVRV